MDINPELRKKYFTEAALALRREGFETERIAEDRMAVSWDGYRLCEASGIGALTYRQENLFTPEREAAKDQAFSIIRNVAEYVRLMENAPVLKADGLDETYRVLADFNGTVLAGHENKYGMQFVTWDWSYDHTGVVQGHYAAHDFEAAKQDFAIRSRLVERYRILNDQQLSEVYRCILDTLDGDIPLTAERERVLKDAVMQIECVVPDLESRVQESCQKEQAEAQGQYPGMTQQF